MNSCGYCSGQRSGCWCSQSGSGCRCKERGSHEPANVVKCSHSRLPPTCCSVEATATRKEDGFIMPSGIYQRPSVEERFWAKVNKTDRCWLWVGGKDRKGYGRFQLNYKSLKAHRLAYELTMGNIPQGLTIDHLCRNHGCVKPTHLETVPNGVNVLRGIGLTAKESRQTACKRGHPFDLFNTYFHKGIRGCRACRQEANRLRYNLRKGIH